MTRIKLCGLSRPCDMDAASELRADYIGFVFAQKSKRYVSPEKAGELKKLLAPGIHAVGVFVDETPEHVAELLNEGIIDIGQLHGQEEERYIKRLRQLSDRPIIKAFRIGDSCDVRSIEQCTADYVLLDSGAGTGKAFDWNRIRAIERPFFLAGGLSADNVAEAMALLHPFAVDVSSGIESDGVKDAAKMAAFIAAVRKEDEK